MSTVAVVTSCTTPDYWQFLRPWALAVAALERTPDEIVIATDLSLEGWAEIAEILPDAEWVAPRTHARTHRAVIVNDAIDWSESDWVCKMDVDDLIHPHALNELDDCTADVYGFGYHVGGIDHIVPALTAHELLDRVDNPLSSCSPFRRWLWERQPFRDMLYDDWAFWRDCAKAGAVFASSGRVDYTYRQHPGQFTARLDHALALDALWSLG